jgi:predicted DNA-binding transcriptional regulator AlpA
VEEVRAIVWESGGRWHGSFEGSEGRGYTASTRDACLAELRKRAGRAVLTIEVYPALVGVAEAAAVLGWDKRRIFTYLRRGSFPSPVATLASGRVWRLADIEAFARTRTRRTPATAVQEPAG